MTEQNTTAETTPVSLNLCCAWCGSELMINCEYTGAAYMQENTPESIECNGPTWCGAVWEPNGTLRTEPSYIKYPNLYERPADWVAG